MTYGTRHVVGEHGRREVGEHSEICASPFGEFPRDHPVARKLMAALRFDLLARCRPLLLASQIAVDPPEISRLAVVDAPELGLDDDYEVVPQHDYVRLGASVTHTGSKPIEQDRPARPRLLPDALSRTVAPCAPAPTSKTSRRSGGHRQHSEPFHAGYEPVRVDDRVRQAHEPQRQALAERRRVPALDGRRDTRRRVSAPPENWPPSAGRKLTPSDGRRRRPSGC